MLIFRNSFLVVSLVLLIVGCGKDSSISGGQGGEGEVVVVLNSEFQKGEAGKVIDEYLRDSYLLLPQHEPMFKLYVIPWSAFSNTFRAYRNIIRIDISPEHREGSAKLINQKGQVLITFTAPDVPTFVALFKRYAEQIIKILTENEIEFAYSKIIKGSDVGVESQISKKHGINLKIPKGYQIRKDTTQFVYLTLETEQMTLGMIIYYYDYASQEQFSVSQLLKTRDSIVGKHIKGPLYPQRMSYMTTTREPVAPLSKVMKIDGDYTVELRGLWHVTEDFMAGPFISYSRYDEAGKRIVTTEGFVYYPNENKRKYMRWFEAIFRHVSFNKPPETSKL